MKKKNISILLAMMLLLTFVFTACAGDEPEDTEEPENEISSTMRDLDAIIESGELVLGTSADYPPYEFHALIDGKDEVVGFEIDIAKKIADELGVELVIKEMDFSNLLSSLSTGMVDIVLSAMNPLPERLEEANFSDVYYEASFSALIREDDMDIIKSVEDLNGKHIGVQMGTTQEAIAESYSDNLLSIAQNPDLVMNLKTDKVDCVLMETPVAKSFVTVNEGLALASEIEIVDDSSGVAAAMQKGNDELTEKVNEIIAKLIEDGSIDKWIVEAQNLSDSAIE